MPKSEFEFIEPTDGPLPHLGGTLVSVLSNLSERRPGQR
jgi:hypothetical protein